MAISIDERMAKALDSKARRAAARGGLRAIKSRRQVDHWTNYGGYMLCDPRTGFPVDGFRFDMSAEDIIRHCNAAEGSTTPGVR